MEKHKNVRKYRQIIQLKSLTIYFLLVIVANTINDRFDRSRIRMMIEIKKVHQILLNFSVFQV